MREARKWGESLVNTRNNLDHGDWTLQSAAVADVGGRVVVSEPLIDGTPVTRWVADMADRVICFVEDGVAPLDSLSRGLIPGLAKGCCVEWLRHRLRALQLKHWKRGPTMHRELRALGASAEVARQVAANSRSWWRNSDRAIKRVLTIAYFDGFGVPRLC